VWCHVPVGVFVGVVVYSAFLYEECGLHWIVTVVSVVVGVCVVDCAFVFV